MLEQGVVSDIAIFFAGVVVTVLTVYGGFIKYNYDGLIGLRQLMKGYDDSPGFIEETREAHQELAASQREIERTLRAHGALLSELVYTLHDVAESLDDEDLENVDTRRLEHLDERLRDEEGPQYRPSTTPDDVESDD